jgi:hypothetical protein
VLDEGEPSDCPSPGAALAALGIAETFSGNASAALELVLGAQAEYEARDDPWLVASVSVLGAAWANSSGEIETAQGLAREAVRRARATSNPSLLAVSLFQLGWCQPDDPVAALAAFEESVALARAGATSSSMGTSLGHAAPLLARAGDVPAALAALREALVYSYEIADRITVDAVLTRGLVTFDEVGHCEAVAVLDGAMRASVIGTRVIPPPRERREEAVAIERSQEAFGRERYERSRARGAAMNYDELIEYLVRELDDLIARVGDD